jgi:DNA-binding Lrp family transcriptional regulator
VDERDCRIIAELVGDPFASCERIGRSVGTTGTSVRACLERMVARAAISGWYAMPSASAFGRRHTMFVFQGLRPEPTLADFLRVADVVSVARGRPGMFIVSTYDLASEGSPLKELTRVTKKAPESTALIEPPAGASSPPSTLSPLDWRIIGALLDDPRAPLVRVSKMTHLTALTVRKRRDRLVADGSFNVAPIIDMSKEPGLVLFSGYISAKDSSVIAHFSFPGLISASAQYEPPGASLFGFSPSYAEVEELQRSLAERPGVLRVDLTAARGGRLATARIRRWVGQELRRWEHSKFKK